MTYKSIVENMIRVNVWKDVETLVNENMSTSQNHPIWIDMYDVRTKQDIKFGISFEVFGEFMSGTVIPRQELIASGYVDEYGDVAICSLWAVLEEGKKLVWTVSGTANNWNLLKVR